MTKSSIAKKISFLFLFLKLFFGLVAIALTFQMQSKLYLAGYFIIFALFADFFISYLHERFKWLWQQQKIINHLINIIPLGLSPSIIIYVLLKNSTLLKGVASSSSFMPVLILIVPFVYVSSVTIRLSNSWLDGTKQKYTGIALQISTFLIASLPLIDVYDSFNLLLFPALGKSTYFLVGAVFFSNILTKGSSVFFLCFFLSMFVVLRLPLFSMKFENFSFKENNLKYFFLIITVALFAFMETIAIPLIFLVYLAFSFFSYRLNRKLQRLSAKKPTLVNPENK
jgi:CDP-diacylglycerol---serine O-phosphatidyltransferase